jgi:hypothetical protein
MPYGKNDSNPLPIRMLWDDWLHIHNGDPPAKDDSARLRIDAVPPWRLPWMAIADMPARDMLARYYAAIGIALGVLSVLLAVLL